MTVTEQRPILIHCTGQAYFVQWRIQFCLPRKNVWLQYQKVDVSEERLQWTPFSPFDYRCKKKKWSRCRPGVAQKVGRGIALLFHNRSTRRGEWSAARPGCTLPPGKTRYPFYKRLRGPQDWSGRAGKSRPHRDSIPDRPARGQSLYRLSYRAHWLARISGEFHYNGHRFASCVFLKRNLSSWRSIDVF